MKMSRYFSMVSMGLGLLVIGAGSCQKTGSVPVTERPAALTIFNAIPNSVGLVPVINTSSSIEYFYLAQTVNYGSYLEYSPTGGDDTVYVVQQNGDTLNLGPKTAGLMFNNILELAAGSIHSLFLTGADTSSPDYLFTTDTLSYYPPSDSVVGIRFVNLSYGSNPVSVNLEGSANGSEVGSLPYKGITSFKQYVNNSTTADYFFVIRDLSTGDSLTQFDFLQSGSSNNGYGLTDPFNNRNLLTFRNITIVVYGSEAIGSPNPLNVMVVDDY